MQELVLKVTIDESGLDYGYALVEPGASNVQTRLAVQVIDDSSSWGQPGDLFHYTIHVVRGEDVTPHEGSSKVDEVSSPIVELDDPENCRVLCFRISLKTDHPTGNPKVGYERELDCHPFFPWPKILLTGETAA